MIFALLLAHIALLMYRHMHKERAQRGTCTLNGEEAVLQRRIGFGHNMGAPRFTMNGFALKRRKKLNLLVPGSMLTILSNVTTRHDAIKGGTSLSE